MVTYREFMAHLRKRCSMRTGNEELRAWQNIREQHFVTSIRNFHNEKGVFQTPSLSTLRRKSVAIESPDCCL